MSTKEDGIKEAQNIKSKPAKSPKPTIKQEDILPAKARAQKEPANQGGSFISFI